MQIKKITHSELFDEKYFTQADIRLLFINAEKKQSLECTWVFENLKNPKKTRQVSIALEKMLTFSFPFSFSHKKILRENIDNVKSNSWPSYQELLSFFTKETYIPWSIVLAVYPKEKNAFSPVILECCIYSWSKCLYLLFLCKTFFLPPSIYSWE